MKTVKSIKALAGQGDVTLVFNVPTFDQIVAHYENNVDHFVDNWVGHKVANDAASRIKLAFGKVFHNTTAKESEQKELTERDKEIIAMVNAGETLDLLTFVGKPRGVKPDDYQLLIREKWEKSDKKAAFLTRLGLDAALVDATAGEVEAAYLSKRDELAELL